MRKTLDNWDKLVKIALSIVTIVAVIIGGGFSLLEYLDKKKEDQVKYTIGQVEAFLRPDMLLVRNKLNKTWNDHYVDLVNTIDPKLKLTRPELARAYRKYVLGLIENYKYETEIETILDFYERMVICVNTSICDQAVINQFFFRKGEIFFHQYSPYVCHQREKWNDPNAWIDVQAYFAPKTLDPDVCEA